MRLLFTDIGNLMYEVEIEYVHDDCSRSKETFDFSNYSAKSKYWEDLNVLVIGKIKDKTGRVFWKIKCI